MGRRDYVQEGINPDADNTSSNGVADDRCTDSGGSDNASSNGSTDDRCADSGSNGSADDICADCGDAGSSAMLQLDK
jgi:hypothetical protein